MWFSDCCIANHKAARKQALDKGSLSWQVYEQLISN